MRGSAYFCRAPSNWAFLQVSRLAATSFMTSAWRANLLAVQLRVSISAKSQVAHPRSSRCHSPAGFCLREALRGTRPAALILSCVHFRGSF